ncbi:PREDICTED: protein LCHN-like isoform X1 [Branchiostoma belcheri]|uniref:DENN domain-containing protein 11 n=1 Tax=Branchiostoma belcheri TaxID=7741 RepID=A0A6P4ZGQ9_BRABE|nr:PREDICTED: protein LCHN-like isoform X1 [Branchiostoma belcheri]
MANDTSEKTPLLDNEDDSSEYRRSREQVKSLYLKASSQRPGIIGPEDLYCRNTINISASNSNFQDIKEADYIVAIFVVAFDTRTGNIIEWCKPEDSDLEGVEFKAMASGSHTILKDFIYFKKDNLYGLSCFENMPVESELERGARMKSVGILATSYTSLYRHMQFLENQVRHQLETPGRYDQLKAFWEDRKGSLPMSHPGRSLVSPMTEIPRADMRITHPAGCFSQFLKFFGEQIFVLWKYALLRRRILFFSPPPIGVVCYRVYCACCLARHTIPEIPEKPLKPHFYVNIADIDRLETEVSYLACTTEKIFQEKSHLYDVYVDNQNVETHIPSLQDMLRLNDSDRDKYSKLLNQSEEVYATLPRTVSEELYSRDIEDDEVADDEQVFITFFTEQNNRIFQTLLDVASTSDRTLTMDHMRSMGLDPIRDRQFVMDLVELHGIDVMLVIDNPCCGV